MAATPAAARITDTTVIRDRTAAARPRHASPTRSSITLVTVEATALARVPATLWRHGCRDRRGDGGGGLRTGPQAGDRRTSRDDRLARRGEGSRERRGGEGHPRRRRDGRRR